MGIFRKAFCMKFKVDVTFDSCIDLASFIGNRVCFFPDATVRPQHIWMRLTKFSKVDAPRFLLTFHYESYVAFWFAFCLKSALDAEEVSYQRTLVVTDASAIQSFISYRQVVGWRLPLFQRFFRLNIVVVVKHQRLVHT